MIKDLNIIIPLRDEDEQVKTTVHMLINELKDLKKFFVITLIDDHSLGISGPIEDKRPT